MSKYINASELARQLGISRSLMSYKMKHYVKENEGGTLDKIAELEAGRVRQGESLWFHECSMAITVIRDKERGWLFSQENVDTLKDRILELKRSPTFLLDKYNILEDAEKLNEDLKEVNYFNRKENN